MLESITDAFYSVDQEWRITYVNARAVQHISELVGSELSREALLGEKLWNVLPAQASAALEDQFRSAVGSSRAVVFEYRRPDSARWFDVHAYPSERGLSIYFQEITDRKTVEIERERRARQQALVSELGLRALANDDMQALMEDAVQLNLLLSRLTGGRVAE